MSVVLSDVWILSPNQQRNTVAAILETVKVDWVWTKSGLPGIETMAILRVPHDHSRAYETLQPSTRHEYSSNRLGSVAPVEGERRDHV